MSTENDRIVSSSALERRTVAKALLHKEFAHLREDWFWFLLLGAVLAVGGTAALVAPAFSSFVAIVVLGVVLVASGIVTLVGSFWAGKWSGLLLQMLVGILYIVAGMSITDNPAVGMLFVTTFLAALFMVLGAFRIVAALMIQFPQWGWAMLNGAVTLLLGVVIYRHLTRDAYWVIGILVGIEMLLNGWTWIMLSLAVRAIPEKAE